MNSKANSKYFSGKKILITSITYPCYKFVLKNYTPRKIEKKQSVQCKIKNGSEKSKANELFMNKMVQLICQLTHFRPMFHLWTNQVIGFY